VTAGITGATQVYLHLAHPSAHARTPQVMNAEFARRCVPHPGLPMLASQVDLILDFLGLSGTGQFHDREGSGTAESTKSFAIMECGDGGLIRGFTWGYMASICVTVTSCVACDISSGLII
jgi:hypothetical protein